MQRKCHLKCTFILQFFFFFFFFWILPNVPGVVEPNAKGIVITEMIIVIGKFIRSWWIYSTMSQNSPVKRHKLNRTSEKCDFFSSENDTCGLVQILTNTLGQLEKFKVTVYTGVKLKFVKIVSKHVLPVATKLTPTPSDPPRQPPPMRTILSQSQ